MEENFPIGFAENIFAHIHKEYAEKELKLADCLTLLKLVLFSNSILLRVIFLKIILHALRKFIEYW